MTSQPEDRKPATKEEILGKALFDVEHALGMYAFSFCTIPAEAIYEKEVITPLMAVIESCHIYLIGYTPIVEFINASQDDRTMNLKFAVLGKDYRVPFDLPEGLSLKQDGRLSYLEDSSGQRSWLSEEYMQQKLNKVSEAVTFDVKYIGQAYGQDGSRNAIDRLLKHETLQKISLKGVPAGYRLSLLLLSIQPSNLLLTVMNPFAKNKDQGAERIKNGLDKLFNTTEIERIALYEASLIRYFYPEFNKEFKDSFPSTNLKILQDCYAKDFSAVIAEICIDDLPFRLFSGSVKSSIYHMAKHDLNKDEDRQMFFGLS